MMTGHSVRRTMVVALRVLGLAGAVVAGLVEWRMHGPYGQADSRIERSVVPATGEEVVAFSARGYGRPDTWGFLDLTRLTRMEFDRDQDGIVDRWEYYDADGSLDRVRERDANGRQVSVDANVLRGGTSPTTR